MAGPRTVRSTETPMDFEFTSRPSSNVKPVWAASNDAPNTPRKRTLTDMNPPTPVFPEPPHTPTRQPFGGNPNIPFIFQSPLPQTPQTPAWAPPPNFTPSKAFPEIQDVDMSDVTPPKPAPTEKSEEMGEEDASDGMRVVAFGGMRRVFNKRQKARARSRLASVRGDEDESDEGEGSDDGMISPVTQNTSNHYTLNMPGPAAPQSDLPYVLLGYLQFFFNLSLILVFLYLLVQFILTVQRDVEQRISEYSMDIVQEIAQCALQYKTNLCVTNPIPAMAHQCATWETCMNRDPTKVGRARVGAELIAEVVNGFVEPISWKTLLFTLSSLGFFTLFINSLLMLYRARVNPSTHMPAPPFPALAPPMPPSQAYPHRYLTPAPSWGDKPWMTEIEQTPSRRRKLEGGGAAKIK